MANFSSRKNDEVDVYTQDDYKIVTGTTNELFTKAMEAVIGKGYRVLSFSHSGSRPGQEKSMFAAVLEKFRPDQQPFATFNIDKYTNVKSDLEMVGKAQDFLDRRMLVTKVCPGYTLPSLFPDKIRYIWMAEMVKDVEAEVVFTTLADHEQIYLYRRKAKFYLADTYAYVEGSTQKFVSVWHKNSPAGSDGDEMVFHKPLDECMAIDQRLGTGYTARIFQAYTAVDGTARCLAVWEPRATKLTTHKITFGADPQGAKNQVEPQMKPAQISCYLTPQGVWTFAILWLSRISHFPPQSPLWTKESDIPIDYLPGSKEGFTKTDLDAMNKVVTTVMIKTQLPGISVAFVKDEKLKFAAAYGYKDVKRNQPLTVDTTFQLASISKTMMSTTIFSLIEEGVLKLDQSVFGPNSIFGTEYGTPPYPADVTAIKIRNLLEHTGGWGYPNVMQDPKITKIAKDSDYISYIMDNVAVTGPPDTYYMYSDFGYYLLSKIVEKVTGRKWYDVLRERAFRKAGIPDERSKLTSFTYRKRQPEEVMYYDSSNGDTYNTPKPDRDGPSGGWMLTPIDMMRFMTCVDGFPGKKDILSAESVKTMTTATKISVGSDFISMFGYGGYAKGWFVDNKEPKWSGYFHGGSASGAAIMARGDDGIEMALAHNMLTTGCNPITVAVEIAGAVHQWPDHDLFAVANRSTNRGTSGTICGALKRLLGLG